MPFWWSHASLQLWLKELRLEKVSETGHKDLADILHQMHMWDTANQIQSQWMNALSCALIVLNSMKNTPWSEGINFLGPIINWLALINTMEMNTSTQQSVSQHKFIRVFLIIPISIMMTFTGMIMFSHTQLVITWLIAATMPMTTATKPTRLTTGFISFSQLLPSDRWCMRFGKIQPPLLDRSHTHPETIETNFLIQIDKI